MPSTGGPTIRSSSFWRCASSGAMRSSRRGRTRPLCPPGGPRWPMRPRRRRTNISATIPNLRSTSCCSRPMRRAYQRRLLAQLAAAPRPPQERAGDAKGASGGLLHRRAVGSFSARARNGLARSRNSRLCGLLRLSDRVRADRQQARRRAMPRSAEARFHRLRGGGRRIRRRRSRRFSACGGCAGAPPKPGSRSSSPRSPRSPMSRPRDLALRLKLLTDSFRLTRPVKDPNIDGLDKDVIGRVGPRIEARTFGGRQTGFDRRAAPDRRPKRCCARCR